MFTGRDEQVRYEQNQDAYRRAEAHRVAKQLPRTGRNLAFLSDALDWLSSRIFRSTSPLMVERQTIEKETDARQSDLDFARAEPIAAQD